LKSELEMEGQEARDPLSFWLKYRMQVVALLFSIGITVLILVFRERLAALAGYGYLGVFCVSVLANATIILPVPGIAVVFASGSVLHPLLVGLIAGVGEPLGELTGYLAGYGGSAIVEDRERFQRVKKWMERRGFLTLFLLSLIPNPLFDLAGIIAGMGHFPVPRFLLACWLGKTLKAVITAYSGFVLLPWITHLVEKWSS